MSVEKQKPEKETINERMKYVELGGNSMADLEEVKRLSKEALDDPDFVAAFNATKTPEEAQELLASRGIELTIDELLKFGEIVAKDELSEEDLQTVSGGFSIVPSLRVSFWIQALWNRTRGFGGPLLPPWIKKAIKK